MPVPFIHLDSGKVETTESFFSDLFLRARVSSGLGSSEGYDPIFSEGRSEQWRQDHWKEIRANELKYDEDVNQYIILTLACLTDPRFLKTVNPLLVGIDSDAGRMAANLEEKGRKYFIYRANADFLLLNLGLFRPDTNILGDAYFDKGGTYYRSAAHTLKSFHGGADGLSDVLEKLAIGFGKYVTLLRTMKNSADNFLSFHFKLSPQDMTDLQEAIASGARNRKPKND